MTAHTTLSDRIQLGIFILWFLLCWAFACAEDAPQPGPLAVPVDAATVPEASAEPDMEQILKAEMERVRKLATQLEIIEKAPLPTIPAPHPAVATEPAPAPAVEELPAAPLEACSEAFANAIYRLGRYREARALYEKILESKPRGDSLVWAQMQAGHCARHLRDYVASVAAYERIINESPTSPWAEEAAWWATQVKWRLIWNETMRQESGPALDAQTS